MKRALPGFIINQEFEKRQYTASQKELIIQFMKSAGDLYAAGGFVDDVIVGKETRIESASFRDDQYEWSTQDIYHIEKYDAAVTDEFIEHVTKSIVKT